MAAERIEKIAGPAVSKVEGDLKASVRLSYSDVLCDKRFSRATLMGCILTSAMQLTGCNAILFYSNTIFSGLDMQANHVTAIIGGVTLLGTFICLMLLFKVGRKTLMVAGYTVMLVSLILLAIFQHLDITIGSVIAALMFQVGLANSATTVTWLYMAEIMRAEAMAIAFFFYWFFSMVVSISVPFIFAATSGFTVFCIFACITLVNLVLIAILMKETKGLTQKETEALFNLEEDE